MMDVRTKEKLLSLEYEDNSQGMREYIEGCERANMFAQDMYEKLGVSEGCLRYYFKKFGKRWCGNPGGKGVEKDRVATSQGVREGLKKLGYEVPDDGDCSDAMRVFLHTSLVRDELSVDQAAKKINVSYHVLSKWIKRLNKSDGTMVKKKVRKKKLKREDKKVIETTKKGKTVELEVKYDGLPDAFEQGTEVGKRLVDASEKIKCNFLRGILQEINKGMKEDQ
jgi:transposase